MDIITSIGFAAAICTTISFVPQAIKIIRTKDTSGISATMYTLFTFGIILWLTFGILTHNPPIILANAVTAILSSIILWCKIRYR